MRRTSSFMKGLGHGGRARHERLFVAGLGLFALGFVLSLPGWDERLWPISPQTHSANESGKTSPEAARALQEKIELLSAPDPEGSTGFQPIVITDVEANSYLKYYGQEFLPPGVYDPEVHIHADRVSGAAEVDFNQLNQTAPKSDDWGPSLAARILKGRERVSAKGKLDTANGQGKLTIEDVEIGTTQIPDWLVSVLLENYVKKRHNIDLSKPLTLPDHVTHIELGDGRATFYRSPNKGQ